MLRSAMVPVDFSDNFPYVLKFAEGLTAIGVKRIVLGHAVDAAGLEGPVIANKVDKVRERIHTMTGGLEEAGLDVEVRVATGEVIDTLISLAAEAQVGLIVAGTHGKGVLSKLFQGSVSENLVSQARVPTMMVRYELLRTAEHPADVARAFGRQVLLPTDFSGSSMRALMSTFELPKGTIGALYLVNVADQSLTGDKARKTEEGAEFQLGNMVQMAAENDISAHPVIRRGDAKRTILQEIDERRATGMVVGSRGPNPLQEVVLGSVSLTLMRQASCPVMIVP